MVLVRYVVGISHSSTLDCGLRAFIFLKSFQVKFWKITKITHQVLLIVE